MAQAVIYTKDDGSVAFAHFRASINAAAEAAKIVPAEADFSIVDYDAIIPTDKTFLAAWVKSGATITVDLPKAKLAAHTLRQAKRLELFTPHDEVVKLQIPSEDAVAAEVSRVAIRVADALVQIAIDAAANIAALKLVLTDYGAAE